jgi:capsular polysaccharide biosynthesis protein
MKRTHSLRNPLILTPLLAVLALAITAVAALELPAHYQAESDVALLPSVSSSKPYGSNPYMSFNSSLPMAAQIISYQLMDPANVQELKAEGYDQPFTVSLAATVTNGPILTTAVSGSDKAAVQRTLDDVTNEISAALARLQKGITKTSRITLLPVSSDLTPKLVISKTARPLVLILVLGLFLAFAIPRVVAGKGRRTTGENQGPSAWADTVPPSAHDMPFPGPVRSAAGTQGGVHRAAISEITRTMGPSPRQGGYDMGTTEFPVLARSRGRAGNDSVPRGEWPGR